MKRSQQARKALGSDVQLTLVAEDARKTSDIFDDLWQQIRLFEASFSRFQPDSELTYVNQQAGARTKVSMEFIALVQESKRLATVTGGLYNPFVLPSLQAAGYKGSWPNPEQVDPETDFSDRKVVKDTELRIGPDWVHIPAKSALDFGGIGKGYLLDQLARWIEKEGIRHYWFSLGGDIICGGNDLDGRPWRVGLQTADSSEIVGNVEHGQGKRLAIATSGVTKRRDANWHHLIDPRTGLPASTDILTATVCSTSATEADVFAKCVVIGGSQTAKNFLEEQKIKTALLQCSDEADIIKLMSFGKILPS